jgi:hypothetical protein
MAAQAGTDAAPAVPKLSLGSGFLLLMFVLVGVAGWIAFGGLVLRLHSFFASFLLLWYWATVEKAEFNRLPAVVAGALVGVALAWLMKLAPAAYGAPGLAAALLVIAAAIFVQIMNWAPVAINACAMLFLTVVAAPAILGSVSFPEVGEAVALGAVYFAILVHGARLYIQFRDRRRGDQPAA